MVKKKRLVQLTVKRLLTVFSQNDVSSMRTLKYAPEYEITVSLLNNNPENMKMDWEIREALNGYLNPFLQQISELSNFSINSQVREKGRCKPAFDIYDF